MTHHIAGSSTQPTSSAAMSRPTLLLPPIAAPPPARLSGEAIRLGIALRRECLADLEAEMVAACEAAAGLDEGHCPAPGDRSRWDRVAWDRYLDAAARLADGYSPRMRRLRDDIALLERLLDLPVAA